MALSPFQRGVCRLLAQNRIGSGESYLAGGATLNELLHAPRLSRDLDVFHDTEEALVAAWQADRSLLTVASYDVRVFRERPGIVEAEVRRGDELVLLQWARDSAFRFFPLIEHEDFGLTLHPFDLATSKVLALVGRLEPRDFVDTLACDAQIQPLGLLAFAACGKDPGFSPAAILEEASRSSRYSAEELNGLDFEGPSPDPQELSRRWRSLLANARQAVAVLPPDHAGRAVLDQSGAPFRGDLAALRDAVGAGGLVFHPGSIRGAWPKPISK
jgi:hypothetical protein